METSARPQAISRPVSRSVAASRSIFARASALATAAVALAAPLALPGTANAAVIAIVDSGVDHKHGALASRMWNNPGEVAGNGLDDDGNTFVDDLLGWNFAENNGEVIDYKYLGRFDGRPMRFFELQKKVLEGTATEEEKAWLKAQASDAKFIKELQVFGNFVHGTHVAGIAAGAADAAPDARVMAIKLLPTEVKLPFGGAVGAREDWGTTRPGPNFGDFLKNLALKELLRQLAKAQGTIFAGVGSYVNGQEARVANLSLGTSTQAASAIVKPLLQLISGREPTDSEVLSFAKVFVGRMVEETAKMAKTSPATLFVIAAGNDGSDNDVLPVAPANIREPNTISVAATLGGAALAPFSNYGATMVDVAAPGVGIESAIPGGSTMFLSGTSQAAPHVAGVAGRVIDANPALGSAEVREIVMATVDAKAFLAGKVKSGGMVNGERAERAAALTATGVPLKEAVARARTEVADLRHASFAADAVREAFLYSPMPTTFVGQKED